MTQGFVNIGFEVLMDARENKKQCSVYPLRERSDFRLRYFDRRQTPLPAFQADFLLHIEGECLSKIAPPKQQSFWLATIDCTWKKLAPALARVEAPIPKLVRIPADFVTAYPRKSKTPGLDPDGGLATIEALFIAAAFLGSWDESLLEKFHFKKEFLELNSALWHKYKLKPQTLE